MIVFLVKDFKMCCYVSVWRSAIINIWSGCSLRICILCVMSSTMKSCTLSYSPRLFGSHADIDTRRRAACDLVRGLCRFFEGPVTGIFSGYVNSMLQEYAKNPSVNWKHKDAAIYLVTSLASKAQTQKVLAHSIHFNLYSFKYYSMHEDCDSFYAASECQ